MIFMENHPICRGRAQIADICQTFLLYNCFLEGLLYVKIPSLARLQCPTGGLRWRSSLPPPDVKQYHHHHHNLLHRLTRHLQQLQHSPHLYLQKKHCPLSQRLDPHQLHHSHRLHNHQKPHHRRHHLQPSMHRSDPSVSCPSSGRSTLTIFFSAWTALFGLVGGGASRSFAESL